MKSTRKREPNTSTISKVLDQHTAELAEISSQLEVTAKMIEHAKAILDKRQAEEASEGLLSFANELCRLAEVDEKLNFQSLSDVIQAAPVVEQPPVPVAIAESPALVCAPTIDFTPIPVQPPKSPIMPVMTQVTPGILFGESLAERIKNKKRKTNDVRLSRRK